MEESSILSAYFSMNFSCSSPLLRQAPVQEFHHLLELEGSARCLPSFEDEKKTAFFSCWISGCFIALGYMQSLVANLRLCCWGVCFEALKSSMRTLVTLEYLQFQVDKPKLEILRNMGCDWTEMHSTTIDWLYSLPYESLAPSLSSNSGSLHSKVS